MKKSLPLNINWNPIYEPVVWCYKHNFIPSMSTSLRSILNFSFDIMSKFFNVPSVADVNYDFPHNGLYESYLNFKKKCDFLSVMFFACHCLLLPSVVCASIQLLCHSWILVLTNIFQIRLYTEFVKSLSKSLPKLNDVRNITIAHNSLV